MRARASAAGVLRTAVAGWRVDLQGRQGDRPERIGIRFTAKGKSYTFDLAPEDALELAATIADTYGLHKRWIDAKELAPDGPEPRRMTGLDVESFRLHIALEAGFDLETAEKLAKNREIDIRKAEKLARDAGPKLAAEILT